MTTPLTEVPIEESPQASFNPDDYDWEKHLKIALDELKIKTAKIDLNWRYYDGNHPRVWLTDRIADMFDDALIHNMAENWIDVAVDAPLKRLKVREWLSANDNSIVVEAAKNIFEDNDLPLEQTDLYRHMRIAGEAFLFAWKDEEREYGWDVSLNDPRNVWWPSDCHRNDPSRVVKVWMDEDAGIWRATVYYRYVVIRLVGPRINDNKTLPMTRFFIVDEDEPGGPHGFEQVPVIRFAMQRKRRSVVDSLKAIQDKINKLVSNKMVAAEFTAWRRLAIMTRQEIDDDDLKLRPNRALVLDPGGGEEGANTSIWEGSATELANYDQSIRDEIDKLFTKADLPGHMQVKSEKVAPSGAAYEADEGPFTEAIIDMQEACAASWVDLFALMGIEDVSPQWRNPHVKSDKDEGDTVKVFVDAGMPLPIALKKYAGWGKDELDELEEAPMSPKDAIAGLTIAALGGVNPGGNPNANDPTQPPNGPPATGSATPPGIPSRN